jgi:hypothetical protein
VGSAADVSVMVPPRANEYRSQSSAFLTDGEGLGSEHPIRGILSGRTEALQLTIAQALVVLMRYYKDL